MKVVNRGYKFKIIPTQEQKDFFLQSFGCARKIYNLYVNELYEKLEKSGYQNGLIKKSDLHLSKYTDFVKEYEFMKKWIRNVYQVQRWILIMQFRNLILNMIGRLIQKEVEKEKRH